ncbi:RICIN domain-containing protein [Kitasatospora sp. NPDC057518]|uniref:RICIN domain-containing protein n=1 Tax=Kitasatospora sp. NPDC057518 TaxID=3346155 RepID=UPI0036ADAC06
MKRLTAVLAVFGSGALTVLGVPGTTAAAPAAVSSWTPYNIQNYNSERCILGPGHGSETGLAQVECAGYADQKWEKHQYLGENYYFLANVNSRLCLLARSQQEARQIDCGAAGADADWYIDTINAADPQWKRLVNRATGTCLVPQNTNLNVPILQATCDYSTNPPADQRWRFINF